MKIYPFSSLIRLVSLILFLACLPYFAHATTFARIKFYRQGSTLLPVKNALVSWTYQGLSGTSGTTTLTDGFGQLSVVLDPGISQGLVVKIGKEGSFLFLDTFQLDPAIDILDTSVILVDSMSCRNDFSVSYMGGGSAPNHYYWCQADTTLGHLLCFYDHSANDGNGRVLYEWFVDGSLHDSATIFTISWFGNPPIFRTLLTLTDYNPHQVCLRLTDRLTGFQTTSCKTIQAPPPPPPGSARLVVNIKASGEEVADSCQLTLIGLPDVVHGLSDTVLKAGILHLQANPGDSTYFYFEQVPQGRYLLYAEPIGTLLSQAYEPTYYRSSLYWETADSIRFSNTNSQYRIDLIPRFNPPGLRPGILSGYVTGLNVVCSTVLVGVPTPLSVPFQSENVRIFIIDAQGRPVASSSLNPDGTFFMDNLPIGNYTLRFDHPLINSAPVPVEFTTASPTMVVQSDVTEFGIGFITQTRKQESEAHIQVYPNPTRDYLFVSGFEDVSTLKVSNQLGKEIALEPGERIGVESLPSGVYFLHGTTKTGQPFVRRFVRN